MFYSPSDQLSVLWKFAVLSGHMQNIVSSGHVWNIGFFIWPYVKQWFTHAPKYQHWEPNATFWQRDIVSM